VDSGASPHPRKIAPGQAVGGSVQFDLHPDGGPQLLHGRGLERPGATVAGDLPEQAGRHAGGASRISLRYRGVDTSGRWPLRVGDPARFRQDLGDAGGGHRGQGRLRPGERLFSPPKGGGKREAPHLFFFARSESIKRLAKVAKREISLAGAMGFKVPLLEEKSSPDDV